MPDASGLGPLIWVGAAVAGVALVLLLWLR